MSDLTLRGTVFQTAYPSVADQQSVLTRHNKRGELIVPDWMTQLVLDGRVFNASNAVQETAVLFGETARGTDNINPSILVDVPAGTTAIPLEVIISPSGTGTAGDWQVYIVTDDGVRYSSGGAAVTPVNMRKDDPVTSSCSVYQAGTQIVASANTDDDTIYVRRLDELEITTAPQHQPVIWSARNNIPPVLVGPAALLVFVIVGNVDASFFFSVKWAEIPTVSV